MANVHSLHHVLRRVETLESPRIIAQVADEEGEGSSTISFGISLISLVVPTTVSTSPAILSHYEGQVLEKVVDDLLICAIR